MRIAVLAVVAIAVVGMDSQTASAEIAWEGNLRAAHAKAQKEGKLMLLHFYRDNCVWCDRLEAGAFQNPQVSSAINQQFVPVKIHGTKNPKLAGMFKITRYPTDVIVTTDGKALSHSTSPQEPAKYLAMLSGGLQASQTGTTMLAQQKASPTPSGPVAPSQPAATPPATSTPPSYALAPPSAVAATGPQMPAAPQVAAPQIPNAPATDPTVAALNMPVQISTASGPQSQPQANQFMLPHAVAGGVQNQLSSARTDGLSLNSPAQKTMSPPTTTAPSVASTSPANAAQPKPTPPLSQSNSTPELALQGFCAVSLMTNAGWVEGKTEFGVVHLGKLYLFASKDAMDTFLQDPIPFTPMLNEIDVVRFFEERRIVAGKREWGVKDPVHGRMFFFADKAARDHFEMTFERYLDASIKVMDQAIQDANPGA